MKITLLCLSLSAVGCGQEPSQLLRQGQLPGLDFPMYLTDGAAGNLWKIDRDRTKTLLATGLSDPRGIATDRFNRLYVAERGAGRLLEVDPEKGTTTVVREGLASPSAVATDSFGEVYVAQDDTSDILRVSDGEQFASFSALPTLFLFGVNDQVVVGLYGSNTVQWGKSGEGGTAEVMNPVGAALDATGRVYVSEGDMTNGRILRFHQQTPGGEPYEVAAALQSPLGIAVDPVGNVYVIEQAAGRLVLVTTDGKRYSWVTGFVDPQYVALTQY